MGLMQYLFLLALFAGLCGILTKSLFLVDVNYLKKDPVTMLFPFTVTFFSTLIIATILSGYPMDQFLIWISAYFFAAWFCLGLLLCNGFQNRRGLFG
jgi:hypothetical protein